MYCKEAYGRRRYEGGKATQVFILFDGDDIEKTE